MTGMSADTTRDPDPKATVHHDEVRNRLDQDKGKAQGNERNESLVSPPPRPQYSMEHNVSSKSGHPRTPTCQEPPPPQQQAQQDTTTNNCDTETNTNTGTIVNRHQNYEIALLEQPSHPNSIELPTTMLVRTSQQPFSLPGAFCIYPGGGRQRRQREGLRSNTKKLVARVALKGTVIYRNRTRTWNTVVMWYQNW